MIRNRLYYRLKPFIPATVRMMARRKVARWQRARSHKVWPIAHGSEKPPKDWRGWPDGKKFALVLTHDVETRRGLSRCRDIVALEMSLGLRSSFNFVPEGNYRVPSELRSELAENGFEVGVHDLNHDGHLFTSRREFGRKAAHINHYLHEWGAVGFRSGFMLHNLDWLHDLDIGYDASTFDTDPFEPQPEGRHTIFPFWVPYNKSRGTNEQAKDGYVELPYTLPQDSTLFILLGEETPEIWMRKLDWIAEHGGMALLDTHPDYMSFDGNRRGGQFDADLYAQFLNYAMKRYGNALWNPLPREVATFVRKQNQGNSDNRWRLRGKRAAVLLFSHYPNDQRPRRAAEALAKEGVSVDVVCLQENSNEAKHETINGVQIFRVPVKRQRDNKIKYVSQYAAFIVRSFLYLTARSLKRRYDLVHVHNMPDVLVFSALVPKSLGARVVLDLHDPMPELMQTIFDLDPNTISVRLLKRLEKWSIAFADRVLTVNAACKRIYSSRSCGAEKITVVLNSPDDEVFHFRPAKLNGARTDPSKPFRILYHGSLVQRNGFDLAVDALEIARTTIPGARLVVCGQETPYFTKVMQSVKERGLQDSVDYVGPRNRQQIVEAIEHCDVGVVPNHRNIFTEINTPTRIFEYLALGKAVIAPKAAGISDYFGPQDLIFFTLGDADDLARKIVFAFSHPEEVERLVTRGQSVYLAHTWGSEKSRLLNTFCELV